MRLVQESAGGESSAENISKKVHLRRYRVHHVRDLQLDLRQLVDQSVAGYAVLPVPAYPHESPGISEHNDRFLCVEQVCFKMVKSQNHSIGLFKVYTLQRVGVGEELGVASYYAE